MRASLCVSRSLSRVGLGLAAERCSAAGGAFVFGHAQQARDDGCIARPQCRCMLRCGRPGVAGRYGLDGTSVQSHRSGGRLVRSALVLSGVPFSAEALNVSMAELGRMVEADGE